MPALTAPRPRDQVGTRDADRFEFCGEACLASALDLGVEAVVAWLRQHEGGERAVHSGTSPQVLIDFCKSRGIGARLVRGPAVQYVAGAVARDHYALVAVWSDHQGNPVPRAQSARLHRGGIGHWLLGYGTTGSSVDVMQPWGGRLLRYNLGSGRDQQLGVEIDHRVAAAPSPRPAPPTAPPVPSPSGGRSGRPRFPSPSGGGAGRGRTRTYVVKSGDTLSAIARAERVTLQRLIAANPQIRNPNLIRPGQRVTIPT